MEGDWDNPEEEEHDSLLPQIGETQVILNQDLEIIFREEITENKPEQLPTAYAQQLFVEPTSYGTWQVTEPQIVNVEHDDNGKDFVSFIFILLLGILCVAVIFYPFSYDDDTTNGGGNHSLALRSAFLGSV